MRLATVSAAAALLLAALCALSAGLTVHTALRLETRWEPRTAACWPAPARHSGISRLGCGLLAVAVEAWGWRYAPHEPPYRCQLCRRRAELGDSRAPADATYVRGLPRYTGAGAFCYSPAECTLQNGECTTSSERCRCLSGHDFASQCLHTCFRMFEGFRAEFAVEDAPNATVTLDCAANATDDLLAGFSFDPTGRLEAIKCPRFANGLSLGGETTVQELEVAEEPNATVTTWCPSRHVVTGLAAPVEGGPLVLRCRQLLKPWYLRSKSCIAELVSTEELSQLQWENPATQWPTQCKEVHQYAIQAATTVNGTLAEIECCRIMKECTPAA